MKCGKTAGVNEEKNFHLVGETVADWLVMLSDDFMAHSDLPGGLAKCIESVFI